MKESHPITKVHYPQRSLAMGTVGDIAAERRNKNAQSLSLALTLLGAAGVLSCVLAHAPPSATWATAGQMSLSLIAYALTRRGYVVTGVVLNVAGPLVQHIAIVALMQRLTVLPFLAPLAVLLAAATLPLRKLYIGLVLACAAIASEAALADLGAIEYMRPAGLLAGAILFLGVIVVISVLHVHGTERAVELAEERDRARELAAAAARSSEERYRLIADNTLDLIALIDDRGLARYLSPSHERVLGYPLNSLLGTASGLLVSADHRPRAEALMRDALREGSSRGELLLITRGGKELLFDSTLTRVNTDTGAMIAALSRDITEQRSLELKLQKAVRMEALGRMARGVAHDFNGLLSVVMGSAEIAQLSLPQDHAAQENLETIRQATRSASRLTRQLVAFSRLESTALELIEPSSELRRLLPLLTSVAGRGVTVASEVETSHQTVALSSGHFEQLLLNLVTNASQAMHGSGSLTLGLRHRRLREEEVSGLPPGRYVELSVRDTGVGIEPEVLPHLFEPFFTTRGDAGGTGLGLATCYGVVTQAGGQILVESNVGVGSTFRVVLPDQAEETCPSSEDMRPRDDARGEALAESKAESKAETMSEATAETMTEAMVETTVESGDRAS